MQRGNGDKQVPTASLSNETPGRGLPRVGWWHGYRGRTFTGCWHDRQEEQIEPFASTSAPFRFKLFFFQLTPETLRLGDVGQGESVPAQARAGPGAGADCGGRG
jgi:hypothetical protein